MFVCCVSEYFLLRTAYLIRIGYILRTKYLYYTCSVCCVNEKFFFSSMLRSAQRKLPTKRTLFIIARTSRFMYGVWALGMGIHARAPLLNRINQFGILLCGQCEMFFLDCWLLGLVRWLWHCCRNQTHIMLNRKTGYVYLLQCKIKFSTQGNWSSRLAF